MLETRVKSWEVFPVEEAREVKNFVETLESSMTMELDENCSAEELLEQLKHLEVRELAVLLHTHTLSHAHRSCRNSRE